MTVTMASHGCYCHHVELTNQGRTPPTLGFSGAISSDRFFKFKNLSNHSAWKHRFPRFVVEMQQTEAPPSKYGTNGRPRPIKMVPATEIVKSRNGSVNGSKQITNGATVIRKDPPITSLAKTKKSGNSQELPPLDEVKVLQSDEGFSWANENYNSVQRSIDVWSSVISLRIRVLLDNAKWAYLGGFTEEKQVGS